MLAEADKGRLELEKALGSKTGFKYVTELANGKFQARCKHPDTKQVRALAGVFDTAEEAAVMVALNKKSPAGGGAVAARAKRKFPCPGSLPQMHALLRCADMHCSRMRRAFGVYRGRPGRS